MRRDSWMLVSVFVLLSSLSLFAERGIQTKRGGMDTPMGDYHLLVIGIDNYASWPKLKCAVRDAKAVRDVLVQEYGFDASRVTEFYDSDATERNIKGAIRKLGRTLTSEDSLLIYYAGHGQLDSFTKEGAWIPVEGDRDNDSQWIRCGLIKNYLRHLSARHVLLISDSCFAGDFFRGERGAPPEITDAYVREAFKKSSRQAITSGGLEPVADAGFNNHSVFAHFLLKELKENQSPFLLPSDLHDRIKGGVAENANQTPILGTLKETGGEVGGEFVLFRKGAGGTMEALLKRKAARLEQLEAMEAEGRRADAEARALEAEKQSELDALDRKIRALEAKVDGGDTGGGTLQQLLALARQQEKQAKDLEALKLKKAEEEATRKAEIARLKKAEAEKRKVAFHADYEDYQEIMNNTYVRPAIKQKAWEAICEAWGVGGSPSAGDSNNGSHGRPGKGAPGVLRWNAEEDRPEMTDVGTLVVRSKKAGKVRLGDGFWSALEPGRGLRWASLPVGDYVVEAEVEGKPWRKTVTVRDEQTTDISISSGPAEGETWSVPELGLALIPVAAGSFQMGSNDGAGDEKPVHSVTISKPFWMGKYEVTQGEYEALMGKNPSKFKADRNPVEKVSWNDAVSFCGKLTERERKAGRLPSGYEYRLPTEAEWEYAARGGDKGRGYKYAGADNAGDVAWYSDSSGKKTHPVGGKQPNELGLYDMSGNVWEWCYDWYDSDYYKQSGGSDPVNESKASDRVVRGGSWGNSAGNVRSALRYRIRLVGTDDGLGFRVCLARSL